MSDVLLPRDVAPMQLGDGLNHRKLQNKTGLELVVGQLVAVESLNVSEAFLSVQLAIADATWRQALLFLVGNAIQDSGTERRDKFRGKTFMVLAMDTTLSTIGDPVYLSGTTPGAVTLVAPANIRKVGQVLTVGVTGKVVVAPHLFQGFGSTPFVLDQKWRDELNGDFEAAAPSTLYVDNVTGSDVTGTGAVGTPFASIGKAILTIPHHRTGLTIDEVVISLVHTGTTYAWGGQNLVGSLDRIKIQGQTDTSANQGQFTPGGGDVAVVNGTVEVSNVALAGTTNDLYKGSWLYIGQGSYDFTDPTNYAHVHTSTYSGGGLHKLLLADNVSAQWAAALTLFDPLVVLPKVNLRAGAYAPGDQATYIYDCADLHLQNLAFQNTTQLRLKGNHALLIDGCTANTMAWFLDGGTVRLRKTYILNSTVAPSYGCLDIANGATLELLAGNTMDGSSVVVPDVGLTTGTLASIWVHSGSHVSVPGGLWLRSHAHIRVNQGTFSRKGSGAITIAVAVQQGGPGYTAPGVIVAREVKAENSAAPYPAGEVALFGPVITNFDYLIAAAGHDMSLADDGDLVTDLTTPNKPWVSADGGASTCSYDPGKGTRVRINDQSAVGMYTILPTAVVQGQEAAIVDWARGEDLFLDLDAQAIDITTTLEFRHPRLGGTSKLWLRGLSAASVAVLTWPANVTWSAGVPPAATSAVYQLYTFEYLPLVDKYYGRHVEVDIS